MNRLSLLHVLLCTYAFIVRGEVKVEDTFVPAECDTIASPSDHVLMYIISITAYFNYLLQRIYYSDGEWRRSLS